MYRLRLLLLMVVSLLATMPYAAESTSPPAIVLAEIYRQGIDVSQYLVSEKYDGVRAIWDGSVLRFRSGNRVNAPAWFTASLPATLLDGELWLARGKFAELSGIVRRSEPQDAEWRRIRYMIFELPGAPGSFVERANRIRAIAGELKLPWLVAVDQFRVADTTALMQRFKQMTKEDAEGLMLHRADALYVTGRSDILLKLKPLQDAEAKVIGYVAGKGRFTGVVGALEMETANGKHFRIGTGLSQAVRQQPPAIGSTVTYRYQELTGNGLPRFPRFWRLREEF